MAINNFSSVKLPTDLVQQARDAAQPMRRSAAGQIEYWATLGRVVEHSGLTEREAREAIENYESVTADTMVSTKQRVLDASTNGSISQRVRDVIVADRQRSENYRAE